MKKLEKQDIKYLSILFSFILLYVVVLSLFGYAYGSTIDYANQHIVIPEYFRTLFYTNKSLLPNFAFNIGLGQNIYYFSYYGLLSPIILLSYILPFIPMYIYIQLISMFMLMLSVYIFYRWINDKYDTKIAFLASVIFLLNSTFFYHFHRHIMFVIYMPFMLGALIGVEKFIKKENGILLTFSTIGLILTNYYFSVPGIIGIGVYTLYLLLKPKKFDYLKLIKIIGLVLIAILTCGAILLPTAYSLLIGRVDTLTSHTISLKDLLLIGSNFKYTFYHAYYSWGLTLICVFSLVYAFFSKKKEKIFLSTVMSLFILLPVCSYILNGFMYLDGKCFIPFIPIILLLVCDFLKDLFKGTVNIKKVATYSTPIIFVLVLNSFNETTFYILIADIILSYLAFYFIKEKNNPKYIYIPIIVICLASQIISSCNEEYIKYTKLRELNSESYYNLANISSFYRTRIEGNEIYTPNKVFDNSSLLSTIYSSTSNKRYFNFIRNIFKTEIINRDNLTITSPNNLLFDIYTGTRYIISKDNNTLGYKQIKEDNGVYLYENDIVFPIGYINHNIMSKREFDSLEYPYSIEALLNYTIVNEDSSNIYKSYIKEYDGKYEITNSENLKYEIKDDHYIIKPDKNIKKKDKSTMTISLDKPVVNNVLIVTFKMNESKKGFACSSNITINGIKNALSCKDWKYHNNNYTFEYVLSSNEPINELNVTFTHDSFDISDIKLYTIDYDYLSRLSSTIIPLQIDKINGEDYILEGTIDAPNESYLKITIPYEDKGFKLYVDDVETDIIILDEAFIGAKLGPGVHNIKLSYYPPLKDEGIVISLFGILLIIVVVLRKIK
jgi:uncharacterized membrane protein YfhO